MKTNYDYLVVGAGLYGAVFAYEAKKKEKHVLSLTREAILPEMYIAKMYMESMSTNMVLIFFIHQIRKYGIMSISSRSSIIISTLRLPYIRMNSTICHST